MGKSTGRKQGFLVCCVLVFFFFFFFFGGGGRFESFLLSISTTGFLS